MVPNQPKEWFLHPLTLWTYSFFLLFSLMELVLYDVIVKTSKELCQWEKYDYSNIVPDIFKALKYRVQMWAHINTLFKTLAKLEIYLSYALIFQIKLPSAKTLVEVSVPVNSLLKPHELFTVIIEVVNVLYISINWKYTEYVVIIYLNTWVAKLLLCFKIQSVFYVQLISL